MPDDSRISVGDRTSSDAELTRAIRTFAQTVRTPRGVGVAPVEMLTATFPKDTIVATPDYPYVSLPVAWDCDIIEWVVLAAGGGEGGASGEFEVRHASWQQYPFMTSIAVVPFFSGQRGSTAGWGLTHLHDGDVVEISIHSSLGVVQATIALRVKLS